MKMKDFSIIVAFDAQYGIGKNGQLAWALPADLKHFKEITTRVVNPAKKNAVIMGRKTWDSLPERFRPLPGRVNVVLSRDESLDSRFRGNDNDSNGNDRGNGNDEGKSVIISASLDQALSQLSVPEIENIFVIGGAQIYLHAMDHPLCQKLYVTHVQGDYSCDAFFPPISKQFMLISASEQYQEGLISFQFSEYLRQS